MINNKTIITVKGKTPKQIYDWWVNLDNDKYVNWHPDHKYWIWLSNNIQNRRLKFREKMGQLDFKFTGYLIEKFPGECILFSHLFFPIKIQFTFKKIVGGTKVSNELMIGFNGFIGRLSDIVIKKVFFTIKKQKISDRHIAEEYGILEEQNLI